MVHLLIIIEASSPFTEPLFLSPFLFHSKYNEAGLLGINTMNFVFNIDAQMKRFWSSGLGKRCRRRKCNSLHSFTQPSKCISQSKNIIEFLNFNANKSSSSQKYLPLCRFSALFGTISIPNEHECYQHHK